MKILDYKSFKNDLVKNLDKIDNDDNVLIVSRVDGKNVVLMSLNQYNSITETLYLNSSFTNSKRLIESIEDMQAGNLYIHNLME
ncbi:type II toxin-antitoxin system Phd/YefM family antitoxin [Chitinophagaceae bacterium LWZ2-11]